MEEQEVVDTCKGRGMVMKKLKTRRTVADRIRGLWEDHVGGLETEIRPLLCQFAYSSIPDRQLQLAQLIDNYAQRIDVHREAKRLHRSHLRGHPES